MTWKQIATGDLEPLTGYAYVLGHVRPPGTGASVRHFEHGRFLIDTGSSASTVENSVATRIGLPVIGESNTIGITGLGRQPLYQATFVFISSGFAVDFTKVSGSEIGTYVPVAPTDLIGILGNDFLSKCKFVRDGSLGRFTLEIRQDW